MNQEKINLAIELYLAGELRRSNLLDDYEYYKLIEHIKESYK